MQDGNTHSANTTQGNYRQPTEKPPCQNHEGKNNVHQPLTYGPYRDKRPAFTLSHYPERKLARNSHGSVPRSHDSFLAHDPAFDF